MATLVATLLGLVQGLVLGASAEGLADVQHGLGLEEGLSRAFYKR